MNIDDEMNAFASSSSSSSSSSFGQYKRIRLYYKRSILSNQKSSLKQKYKLSSGVPNSDCTNSKDQ